MHTMCKIISLHSTNEAFTLNGPSRTQLRLYQTLSVEQAPASRTVVTSPEDNHTLQHPLTRAMQYAHHDSVESKTSLGGRSTVSPIFEFGASENVPTPQTTVLGRNPHALRPF